jgi:hypothetical protein
LDIGFRYSLFASLGKSMRKESYENNLPKRNNETVIGIENFANNSIKTYGG